MQPMAETTALVVFIRTDSPRYEEETIRVRTLQDLMKVCRENRPHRLLDRVHILAQSGATKHDLHLGFVSVSESK